MNDPERLAVVDEWLEICAEDLATATHPDLPLSVRCYHAQQAAEKALKAALIVDGLDFPKTHDLEIIGELLADQSLIAATAAQLEWLTRWATSRRYPGATDVPTANDAERVVAIATSIVDAARAYIDRAND